MDVWGCGVEKTTFYIRTFNLHCQTAELELKSNNLQTNKQTNKQQNKHTANMKPLKSHAVFFTAGIDCHAGLSQLVVVGYSLNP